MSEELFYCDACGQIGLWSFVKEGSKCWACGDPVTMFRSPTQEQRIAALETEIEALREQVIDWHPIRSKADYPPEKQRVDVTWPDGLVSVDWHTEGLWARCDPPIAWRERPTAYEGGEDE